MRYAQLSLGGGELHNTLMEKKEKKGVERSVST